MEIKLRDYQLKFVDDVYKCIISGQKKILGFAPTGAGKTIISSQIVADATAKKRKVLFVVHRDILVKQTADKFAKFNLSNLGFIKSGYPENRSAIVQIASLQTLLKRKWWQNTHFDLIVFDEAHLTAFAKLSQRMMQEIFPNSIYLGLTATPFRLKKDEEMGDIFDVLVSAPYPHELIDRGFLVKPSYYGIDSKDLAKQIDLESIRVVNGEYDKAQIALEVDRPELNQKIVDDWIKMAIGRRTIVFAVSVQHSKNIVDSFNCAAIKAAHVDGSTPIKDRSLIYRELAKGEISILSSCMALTEGFDVPSVEAIVLARPTLSKALYYQMIGRGLRLSPETDKQDCLILDPVGNVSKHGFVEDLNSISLNNSEMAEVGEAPLKTCPSDDGGCDAIVYAFYLRCPHCGYHFEIRRLSLAIDLKQQLSVEDEQKLLVYRSKLRSAIKHQYSPGWAVNWFRERYGHWPPKDWSRGAIFDHQCDSTRINQYREYLQVVADRSGKQASWIEYYLKLEFGRTSTLITVPSA